MLVSVFTLYIHTLRTIPKNLLLRSTLSSSLNSSTGIIIDRMINLKEGLRRLKQQQYEERPGPRADLRKKEDHHYYREPFVHWS